MTMIDFLISNSVLISIILRVISCIILLVFCIPLQIKEARVANGLRLLRIQLLAFGLILFHTNLFSLFFLIDAWGVEQKPLNASLQIINAIAFLSLALIGNRIYRTQYTEPIKEAHEEIERLEKSKSKKAFDEQAKKYI
jgi:uncharacterized membrane protein